MDRLELIKRRIKILNILSTGFLLAGLLGMFLAPDTELIYVIGFLLGFAFALGQWRYTLVVRRDPGLRSSLSASKSPAATPAEKSAATFGFLFGLLPGLCIFVVSLVVYDEFTFGVIGLVAGLIVYLIIRAGLLSGFKAVSRDASGTESRETKRCPACAEDVLAEAIKCKHCGESLIS